MSKPNELLEIPTGERAILQGNQAFALGVLHAGYHAADGYPGTPSTEVMETLLGAPDRIKAGWSVNEAVAVGVATGHAIAGSDALATMKVPGLFQAADVVASAASSGAFSGALVLFVATDHAPSSSQYLVDARHFLSSLHLPILEPRDHQDLYRSARVAADLSRRFGTPVAILCSSVLCHAEGIVRIEDSRRVEPAPRSLRTGQVLLPQDALRAHRDAIRDKIPALRSWVEASDLVSETAGTTSFGIVACGEAALIARESLGLLGVEAPVLTVGMTHPLPLERIRAFAERIEGDVYLFEDGERFVETSLRAEGVRLVGKQQHPATTNWTPDQIVQILSSREGLPAPLAASAIPSSSVKRPPSICPGCPYKPVSLAIQSLKNSGRIDLVFGDIGCSTLLHHQDALDINLCMGASDAMRQGYALSRPASAARVISMIGDSSECHSGMDASRNAIFRKIPGVKLVLDNRAIAMTGGQPSPTSPSASGRPATFRLVDALRSEGARAIAVDAYDHDAVRRALDEALRLAADGLFSTVVLEGSCIEVADRKPKRGTSLRIDADQCLQCGLCDVCPGIDSAIGQIPSFNALCTRCGDGTELCMSVCPVRAIGVIDHVPMPGAAAPAGTSAPVLASTLQPGSTSAASSTAPELPPSLRVAICGVGGQGNLFLGKVLAQVVRSTSYFETNIVKGEVHGMSQKGGSVCSTFACGEVHSPLFAAGSADFLIAMERAELLRPEFLGLLKPGGAILLNDHAILPARLSPGEYPELEAIRTATSPFQLWVIRANEMAPRNANAVLLGLLSGIGPFQTVVLETWLETLRKLSPTEGIRQGNLYAFHRGRQQSEKGPTAAPTAWSEHLSR